jgi:flagellar export protein FliJ
MAVSRALRRLLSVLEIQEEQSRSALESAVADLRHLEAALNATVDRERRGRRLVTLSADTGELVDRLTGIEEMLAASRHAVALKPKIALTERSVDACRNEFLGKRIERRQAETLIDKTEAEDAIGAGRRAQREVDDRFLSQTHRAGDMRDKA